MIGLIVKKKRGWIMECMEAIKERRSIRRFRDKTIGKEMLESLLNAAQMAPSAGNLQARDFIIITCENTKQKLIKASLNQSFIAKAPVVIVAVANIERSSLKYGSRGTLYAIQDASAGVMNLLLAAHSIGLSTCWIGAFDERAVSELLKLPPGAMPIAIIPVGYPDEKPQMPVRMGLDKVIHMETW